MTLAICFNKISFTIMQSYISINNEYIYILYDASRINLDMEKIIKSDKVKYVELNRFKLLYFLLLSIIGKVKITLIPHHKLGRLSGNYIKKFAKCIHYIDDGMDAIRDNPKNLDLSKYNKDSIYYTFKEYKPFGKWLNDKKIKQIASIKNLLDDKPAFVIENGILVVESPGIDTNSVENSSENIYLFQHPNITKRLDWNCQYTLIDGQRYSVEKTMLSMKRGEIIIGETMSLIICLHSGLLTNKAHVKLFLKNINNLSSVVLLTNKFENISIFNTE